MLTRALLLDAGKTHGYCSVAEDLHIIDWGGRYWYDSGVSFNHMRVFRPTRREIQIQVNLDATAIP